VQLLFAGIILPLPHIRAGKLKPIAYAGVARHPLLPDVPTFAENGLPGFESRGWFGAFAPRGTPSPIAQTLAARLWEAASSRDLGENFLVPHGFEVPTVSPGHFPEFLLKDQQKWSRAVSLLGAKLKQ
jgi:tripartite-type tricarboxylate transporter receptor subunit TctC